MAAPRRPLPPAFDALGQRVRAIALVQQHLHEAPQIASVDLAEYLTRLAEGLGQLRRAGRIAVTVETGRTALLEPRRVNALGMILAEIVAECLDGTDEGSACVTRVEVPGISRPIRCGCGSPRAASPANRRRACRGSVPG